MCSVLYREVKCAVSFVMVYVCMCVYSVLYREVNCTMAFIESLKCSVLYREVNCTMAFIESLKCTVSYIERLNVQYPLQRV